MLEEIARKYAMTEASLRFLIKRGIIQKDPAGKDMDILSALGQIWQNLAWLKMSLRRRIKSKALREKFIQELDLTKPERYVLNRYQNAKCRLSLDQLSKEVSFYYGLPENVARGIVMKMRKRAYMAKYRQKPGKNGQRRPRRQPDRAAVAPSASRLKPPETFLGSSQTRPIGL
ncbi:MAG: hypothetical protein M0022_10355 [Desulfobacteraceae bacterium]|nr:hypothetical protein [Desulfobacteraceae bacterium]